MESALITIDEFIKAKTPHHVVTADASMLVMAQDDPELRRIIGKADLVTPDSVGILWAAGRKGTALKERVSGVDIVDNLCRLSAANGYRIFFFGAAPGVADQAAERMRQKYPGAQIVGTRSGFYTDSEADSIVQMIRDSQADVVAVAMGIPRQEKWIDANRDKLNASMLIGVGGTLDVLSGTVRRAPIIMQKLALEWLWRVLSNPKKITKVMLLPRFVRLIIQNR
jgi:N-acetylglucosaminyldiphosphoundecaprenol N-acetyl-beta-D-mannosaminyltransferase